MLHLVFPKTGLVARRLFTLLTVLCFSVNNNYAQGFRIGAQAQVVVSGSPAIVIQNGHFINEGHFKAGEGMVALSGNGSQSSEIRGSDTTSFYNLGVARPVGGVRLAADIFVGNELRMTGGLLELNQYQIDLDFTGNIVNETEDNRITGIWGGSVKRQMLLDAPVLTNPGNLGFSITSDANLGLTTIIRRHKPQTNEAGTGLSIARTYEVSPENNTGLNATVRFQFFDAELNGLSASELQQWSSDNQLDWHDNNRDSFSTAGRWIEKSGYQSFQKIMTLGSNDTHPLPLHLIWFTAQNQNEKSVLDWELYNNNLAVGRMEVERSATAANGSFSLIGTVLQPAGQQLKFQFVDEKPLPGANFYRLKLIGADGSVVYSPVRRVVLKEQVAAQVYPMPVTDRLNVKLTATAPAPLELFLLNTSGQKVLARHITLQTGTNTIELSMGQLPSGLYFLKFSQPEYQDVKIIKQ